MNNINLPKVYIIILNWNGWEDTIECLESLKSITYTNYCIVIIDNGSKDTSIGKIVEYCNHQPNFEFYNFKYNGKTKNMSKTKIKMNKKLIILLKNEKNYGFAKGNNIGIKYAFQHGDPNYILLLNNDTIVEKEFLTILVKTAEENHKFANIQPLLLKPGGEVIDSLGQELIKWQIKDIGINSYCSEYKNLLNNNYNEIFGACNAAVLYRSDVLKKIGLFDENFFAIFEDVDLAWRIRLGGFKSIIVSGAIVYHKRGISGRTSSREGEKKLIKLYHGSKNWLLILIRYYPLSMICYIILMFPWRFLLYLFNAIYYACRLNNLLQLFKTLNQSFNIRRNLKMNPLLNAVQHCWIKIKDINIRQPQVKTSK